MGRLIGVGLGPGDPDLMTVRARELVLKAQHVAYFRKRGRPGHARRIVEGLLSPAATEYPMEYPVTTELPFDSIEYVRALARFYDVWARRLQALAQTHDVLVLCEGDPFFYGSFMHLYTRLRDRVPVDVVPGMPGMVGCWWALGQPFTWGDDTVTVLMGTLPQERLEAHMRSADALVIMKIGRRLPSVRQALERAGRLEQAWLVQHGTMPGQVIARLTDWPHSHCSYFAVVLVHGSGRRPECEE